MSELGAVQAKMKCNTVEVKDYGHGYKQNRVDLGAVCSQTGENKAFTDATPSGGCWMNITTGYPALDFFEPGAEYYVMFTKVPKPEKK